VSAELTEGRDTMRLNRNAKTGLILAAIALVFFAAIIAKYWLLR
jgi:hypothetical protein